MRRLSQKCLCLVPKAVGSVISYVTFILSLFVGHIFLVWYLWKVVLLDCGISWRSLLMILIYLIYILNVLNTLQFSM